MSFVELLKKSREQAHQQVQEIANKIKEVNSTEDKLDIIKTEFIDVPVIKKSITLRQKLRQELLKAYGLRKKLFHKDKFAKHTYKLLNENKLYLKDFEFCFNNLEGLNKNSLNYKLLGGDVMLLVQKHIKNNLTLEQTLNQEVEE